MDLRQQVASKPSKAVERIRHVLQDWLGSEPPDFAILVHWLEGFSLPATGEEEPYLLLLQGLFGIENYADRVFTLRIVQFLESSPDVNRPGNSPDEVLFNLFRLCANYSRPLHLARPLQAILSRQQVSGAFEGTDLRAVLRDA